MASLRKATLQVADCDKITAICGKQHECSIVATAADNIRTFNDIWRLCIAILIDATHSMKDGIDQVKAKIKTELLEGLFER